MSLRDRIGLDAGKTRLEDAIQWAIDNEFYFLDFNADIGPNHMDKWTVDRARNVRDMCKSNNIIYSHITADNISLIHENVTLKILKCYLNTFLIKKLLVTRKYTLIIK